ncbi:hypothetical protein V2J09_011660 [Rumex salicifolius]
MIPYSIDMVAKEIIQATTSGSLSKQCEFDVGKGVDDSSGPCKDEDGIFEMEDLGEAKGDKKPISDQEPSIKIIYSSVSRSSRKKLYELLNCWSKWHAQNCLSEKVPVEPVEDGEETFFPALNVGLDKSSTVSFWMDGQIRKRQRTESLSMDNDSTPLYDRNYPLGMALDGGSVDENSPPDLREAARCFNCASYSHSLKECSKPYNNVAVNNARKEFQSKKSKNSGSRLRTRYYQDSPAGKYDGLKPGCLSSETRELLGLKDHEPAPWLARMRQLGYPPGYLDSEEKDQPSGIMIYGDDDTNCNNGNDCKPDSKVPPKKMSVAFPGINAPIPKNADPKAWEKVQGLQSSEFSHPQPDKIFNHVPPPPYNLHGLDRSPSLHYNYESPSLHYNYESPRPPPPPPLNFDRPNYFQDTSLRYPNDLVSPRGIRIPRSPVPHGFASPHFMSRSPSFPGDNLFHNPNSPSPDSFMRTKDLGFEEWRNKIFLK